MKKPRISLIIPAYNEQKFIGKTLWSVLKAKETYKEPSLVEIIVVNNCSTDNTQEIAENCGARVVIEEKRRISSVKNKGVKEAKGEIIGFLDADSYITPNIFNTLDEAMSKENCFGGGTRVKLERNSIGIFCTYCITVFPAKWLLGVAGGLIFTRKSAFDEVGGFDETLYCAEDSKFILDLKNYGKQTRKKFKIITKDYVVTSARSFDKFGDWYYFKNLPKILFKMKKVFRSEEFAKKFWYDVER
jgi:glycosyltransferase involved in cell wall biosynthesis